MFGFMLQMFRSRRRSRLRPGQARGLSLKGLASRSKPPLGHLGERDL